jgi:hypothetical protein
VRFCFGNSNKCGVVFCEFTGNSDPSLTAVISRNYSQWRGFGDKTLKR